VLERCVYTIEETLAKLQVLQELTRKNTAKHTNTTNLRTQ